MSESDGSGDSEPDWVNPANDRKTPYSEEEIDRFVDDFILGLDKQEWVSIKLKYGEKKARERIRAGFIGMDENNIINMTPTGPMN
ncbi:MAG: hypothetical protein V7752_14180 [Halopseudomonas sp.]